MVTATGNWNRPTRSPSAAKLSGTVKEVFVDTNDQVTKGQPLAKLDTSKLEQQTESSRATAAYRLTSRPSSGHRRRE